MKTDSQKEKKSQKREKSQKKKEKTKSVSPIGTRS